MAPSAAIVIGLAAIGWCWHMSSKITAIEQQLADGGNTKLVAELQKPKSPEQLKAVLSTVIAQVRTAKADGKRPDQAKVVPLSAALSQVVRNNPDMSEAWQASAQLISFRTSFEAPSLFPDSCFSSGNRMENQPPAPSPTIRYALVVDLKNCTADLSDAASFSATKGKQIAEQTDRVLPKPTLVILHFENAHILYRGGPLLPGVFRYEFVNCVFDFDLPQPPSEDGRKITQQLLEANNLQDVTVSGF